MSVAILAADDLATAAPERALREDGGFLLRPAAAAGDFASVWRAVRRFFDLPGEVKQDLAVERSPHFRGWSEMKNERDWREQIHFGRERPAVGDEPAYLRLQGPNLWPIDAELQRVMLAYMESTATMGANVLHAVARVLGVDPAAFGAVGHDGYLLLKLIRYLTQPIAATRRSGVAAHVDFSWLTLTLSEREGLQVRRPDGRWIDVEPDQGAWWVHAGELLELATLGRLRATPHRVVNPSAQVARLSMPLFLNPPLAHVVQPLPGLAPVADARDDGHVHRVLRPGAPPPPFVFGEAEWRRKGENVWCAECVQSPHPGPNPKTY